MANSKEHFALYSIDEQEGKKSFWTKIGVAFENKDGSFNLVLTMIPLNGKIHMRKWEPKNQEGGE